MNTIEIITKKRDNKTLSQEEICHIVTGAVDGSIPDYQLSAFLMAVFLNGLDYNETFFLTKAMLESGKTLDFSDIDGIKTDKHSTGGVADTTTLILSPAVSSLGVPVIKMSGKGLGFSGGTIDKLSSIPNFTTEISMENAKKFVKKSNIVLMSQSENLAPADKIFYALRDATGTVENIPLIISSILSKKFATGSDAIVFDVKCGKGAFMKDLDSAHELADGLISISRKFNKKAVAVISSMNQPLGNYIGNSLEVMEAIEVLKGNVKGDLFEISAVLGGAMLYLSGKSKNIDDGKVLIKETIQNGSALEKFKELIVQQNGNPEIINDYSYLLKDKITSELKAEKDGYIYSVDTEKFGIASVETGAGRHTKEEQIDLYAGIILNRRIGDYVNKGDTIAKIISSTEEKCKTALEILSCAVEISDVKPKEEPLVFDIID